MAYTLKCWQFTKKRNSTARPSDNDAYSYSVVLKENTSLIAPTFILSGTTIGNFNYNYCHFDSRYYFIENVTSIANQKLLVECSVDVLATYKTTIGNYSCQIARCTGTETHNGTLYPNISRVDVMAKDPYVHSTSKLRGAITIDGVTSESQGAANFSTTNTSLSFTVFGEHGTHIVNTKDYSVQEISEILFADQSWWDALTAGSNSPAQYVKNMICLPLRFSSGYTSTGTLTVGNLNTGAFTKCIMGTSPDEHGRFVSKSYTFNISAYGGRVMLIPPVYDEQYGDFRDFDPEWVTVSLRLPFLGVIDLDPKFLFYDKIIATYQIDMATGETGLYIYAATSVEEDEEIMPILYTTLNIGIEIPWTADTINGAAISDFMQSQFDTAKTAVDAVVSGVMMPLSIPSGLVNASFSAAQTGVKSAILDGGAAHAYTTMGNTGGAASWYNVNAASISILISESTDRMGYMSTLGYPCYKAERTISSSVSAGAFVQVVNPSVAINGFECEAAQINAQLATGFYYE